MNLKWWVHAWLQRRGYRLTRIRPPAPHRYLDVLELLLRDRLRSASTIQFLQIGANDGATEDPLAPLFDRLPLAGILVEPQPRVFARLQANHGHRPGFVFENVVVGDRAGEALLHVPRADPLLPERLWQAASLDRRQLESVLRRHLEEHGHRREARRVADLVETLRLPAVTIEGLLARHHRTALDLLVIDTMGYDFEILRRFPLGRMAPAIIQYEHRLLSPADRRAAIELLARHDYCFCDVEMDTIAVHGGPVRRGEYAF